MSCTAGSAFGSVGGLAGRSVGGPVVGSVGGPVDGSSGAAEMNAGSDVGGGSVNVTSAWVPDVLACAVDAAAWVASVGLASASWVRTGIVSLSLEAWIHVVAWTGWAAPHVASWTSTTWTEACAAAAKFGHWVEPTSTADMVGLLTVLFLAAAATATVHAVHAAGMCTEPQLTPPFCGRRSHATPSYTPICHDRLRTTPPHTPIRTLTRRPLSMHGADWTAWAATAAGTRPSTEAATAGGTRASTEAATAAGTRAGTRARTWADDEHNDADKDHEDCDHRADDGNAASTPSTAVANARAAAALAPSPGPGAGFGSGFGPGQRLGAGRQDSKRRHACVQSDNDERPARTADAPPAQKRLAPCREKAV
jgi:hypothetical protein